MWMLVPAVVTKKRQEIRAEHVKCRDACSDRTDPEHPRRVRVRRRKNGVLAKKTREPREPGDGEACDTERDERNRHMLPQTTHVAKILFPAEPVNHAAGTQEEQSFEKRMRRQMEDTR